MNTNDKKISEMSINEINDFVISELKLTTLAKQTKDHVNAYRYLNWQIEPEILQIIARMQLWKRWGYDDLFLSLRCEAGLSAEDAKEVVNFAKKYKYE